MSPESVHTGCDHCNEQVSPLGGSNVLLNLKDQLFLKFLQGTLECTNIYAECLHACLNSRAAPSCDSKVAEALLKSVYVCLFLRVR